MWDQSPEVYTQHAWQWIWLSREFIRLIRGHSSQFHEINTQAWTVWPHQSDLWSNTYTHFMLQYPCRSTCVWLKRTTEPRSIHKQQFYCSYKSTTNLMVTENKPLPYYSLLSQITSSLTLWRFYETAIWVCRLMQWGFAFDKQTRKGLVTISQPTCSRILPNMRRTDIFSFFWFSPNSKSSLRRSHQFIYIAYHAEITALTTTPNTTLATATNVRTWQEDMLICFTHLIVRK